jgi:hypothetical protein
MFNTIYYPITCFILQTLFFHYFLRRLPKLAVAVWSCLVVASKWVLVGACSSFRSHQFICLRVHSCRLYFGLQMVLSLKAGIKTNKILCIDKWTPNNGHLQITESYQKAWVVVILCLINISA